MPTAELTDLINEVADIYNISAADIDTEVDYVISGTLDLDNIPEDVTQEEVEEALINSLAEELGVHPKDVEIISIDMDTGKVEYEISADTFEEAEKLQEELIANVTASEIEENIQKVIPEISV